jgi:integrase
MSLMSEADPIMPRKAKAPSAKQAKKRALRYLAPVMNSAGQAVAWRFVPGPDLRAKGHISAVLKHPTGRAFSLAEAQAHRDAALSSPRTSLVLGKEVALKVTEGELVKSLRKAPTNPRQMPERDRTLNALWLWYQQSDDFLDKKPATRRFYVTMIKSSLAWAGHEPIAALDGDLLRKRFKAMAKEKGVSTANGCLRALQAVMAYGERINWGTSPARGLRLERPKGRTRCATPDEAAALIAAADALAAHFGNDIYISMGDAIVAALWTAQSQQDLIACNLTAQRINPTNDLDAREAPYGRLDFSGDHARIKTGGQTKVKILAPLYNRLAKPITGRSNNGQDGLLTPGPDGQKWKADYFRNIYQRVRAQAAKTTPSVIDLQFRDLRDTAITRSYAAGNSPEDIANVSTHGPSMTRDLTNHYLVMRTAQADIVMDKLEAWANSNGIAV